MKQPKTPSPDSWQSSIDAMAHDRTWRRPFITALAVGSCVALVADKLVERALEAARR
jgi:hypothetical protein